MSPESSTQDRSASAVEKLSRLRTALDHREPDRVPVSDFFWGSFVEEWQQHMGLPEDVNPYDYYDLDWIVANPNMDPRIQQFEVLEEDQNQVVVKTGFGAVMRKKFDAPMPEQVDWETDSLEKLENFEFDDPYDRRRYYETGDDHVNGVADGYQRNIPPWVDTIKELRSDIPVYGGVMECSECLTRMVGQYNAMLWSGLHPERFGRQVNRIGEFFLECTKAQIEAAEGLLDGLVIWGDVAYKQSTFYSPSYWRRYFKPWVDSMVDVAHENDLDVIYHGCGDISEILPDYIETGIDAMNPLEAKAGLDAVELRQEYGHRLGIAGNSDITVWESGDRERIRAEVLRKLNAAKGGGYIFMSDHSVTGNVSPATYDWIISLVREHGQYPLDLGEYDQEMPS